MSSYRQLVTPRLDVKVLPGWCLGHVRQSFNVPAWESRAYYAAEQTKRRHYERAMPNVIVPVWFWHWGTYGRPAVTGEFGHVLLWVPGRGFLSSPSHSKWVNGREVEWAQWFSSIEAVERVFGATYRFWSEDMGGVRVVAPSSKPSPPATLDPFRYDEEDIMKPTVHFRTTNGDEWMRAAPEIGADLKPGETRKDGAVTVFRGYEVTTDKNIGTAWARTHARGVGGETSRTNRAGYIAIQAQATRLSVELHR